MAKTKIVSTRTTTIDTNTNRFSKAGRLTGSSKKTGTITNTTTSFLESKRTFRGSQAIGIAKTLFLILLLIAIFRFIFSNGESNIFTLRWFLDTIASPDLPYLDLSFSNVLADLIPALPINGGFLGVLAFFVNSIADLLNLLISVGYILVGFVWNLLVGIYWILFSIFGIGGFSL